MSKTETIQKAMIAALKNKEQQRKEVLSLLLSALKAKAKDKKEPLTEAEEDAIIAKEIKQTKETLSSAPKDRTDIIDECNFMLKVMSEFAPKQLDEDELRKIVSEVIGNLGIENPSAKDKGVVMKNLMPLVKGKADGGLVNKIVSEYLG